MVTIEQVKTEWYGDTVINQTRLNDEIVRVPLLHSKYLDYFVYFRAKVAASRKKINTLKNLKRRYYRGEMDLADLKEHGWEQWQGLKPNGTELRDLFEQDADLNDLEEKLEYYNTGLSTVEYILKSINARGYELRTLFELRKFESGG